MILKKIFYITLLCCFVFSSVAFSASTPFDHSLWDAFLKKYVNEKGEVNYRAIVQDPKELNDYLTHLMAADPFAVTKRWPREEAMAFWLNAYHALLIKLIVESYPIASVQKIPSVSDIAAFRLGDPKTGQTQYSLNDIRAKNLIGTYRDEKIHLALSVGARGGPRLMREAFTGPKVEGQLFLLTRQFVNDPAKVDITPGRKKIRISKVFKWYGSDFNLDFGTPQPIGKLSPIESAVLSFLAYYLGDEAKSEFLEDGAYKIEYLPFDWSLNDQVGQPGTA
jgi:hypothetical protein